MSVPSEPIIYRRPLTLSNSVELYWYPPLNNGGNVITSYIIESANIPYINILPSTDRKSIITNLITGNTYYFTIKATNINGNSNISSFHYVNPGFKPLNPSNINITNDMSNIYFSFNNSLDIGNSSLTYNTVTFNPLDMYGNISNIQAFTYNQSSYGSNIIDPLNTKFLNSNFSYQCFIQSINTVNDSDKSYFDPYINTKIPTNGLKLWLDPYDRSTLTISNNIVTKLIDKSGNKSNAFIIPPFGPSYDSGNCLLNFNGLQYLTLPDNTIPSGNSSYSIFMYVSTSNISRNGQWFLYSGTPTSNLSLEGLINSNTVIHSWFGNQQVSNINISSNISYLVEFTYSYAYTPNGYDSGIRRLFINGSLVGLENISPRNSTVSNNLIGTNSNLTANLVGSIGDVIIYNRLLSDTERNSVKNYLEIKKQNVSLQNVGNLITWLDATDSSSIWNGNLESKIDYGSKVFNWLDRSSANNNATQSNVSLLPTRRPFTQNNLDTLEFNESYLTIPSASYPIDAFIVLKLANISDQNGILGIGPSGNNYSSLSDISGSRWAIDATSNSVVASSTETSSNFLLMEWSIGNNNNYIRRYGSNIANTTTGTWTLPNNSNIYIGNANGFDFSKRFKGYIGEIMMFNKQLDDGDRYPIEGYLAWKWGLQSNLPFDHPYRNSAPYLFYKYLSISGNSNVVVNNLFNPSNISGLSLWLDGNDPNTLFSDATANILATTGNGIARWNDKSGNGNYLIQNTTSARPVYQQFNSLPGIYFTDGTKQLQTINNNSVTGSTERTLFVLINCPSNTSRLTFGTGSHAINTPGTAFGIDLLNNTSNLWYPYLYNSLDINVSVRLTSLTLIQANFSNNLVIGKYNFGNQSSKSGNVNTTVSPWYFGVRPDNQVSNNSYLHEFLLFNRTLSTTEVNQIEGYIAWKWGLQSNLPTIHPFKTFAPTNVFAPSYIGNLQLWLDSQDSSKLTTSGSNVTAWTDKSTNGYVFNSVTTNYPTLNSINSKQAISVVGDAVALANTQRFYNSSFTLNNSNYTIFTVAKQNASTQGRLGYSLMITSARDICLQYGGVNTNFGSYTGNGTSWNDVSANSPNYSVKNAFIGCMTVSSSTLIPYYNGLTQTTKTGTTGTFTGLFIGDADNSRTGYTWSGQIGEILVYNQTLSTTDRQMVEGYLAWKWGLQSNLPSNHPYKTAAP
jgi:hypothetical protein